MLDQDKTYRIVLAENPNLWIGANNRDNCIIKPVITDGEMQTWSLKNWRYVLDDVWYIGIEGPNVVVRYNQTDAPQFHVVQVHGDVYRIELVDTNKAWTVADDPEAPVTLTPAGSVEPRFQEFRFIFKE